MDNYDESLEIGLASGLDVPTAMVLSERTTPKGLGCSFFIYMMLIMIGMTIVLNVTTNRISRYYEECASMTAEKSE